jgi:hypothetical protein
MVSAHGFTLILSIICITKGARLAGGIVPQGKGEERSERHAGRHCFVVSVVLIVSYRRSNSDINFLEVILDIYLPQPHYLRRFVEGTDQKGADIVGVEYFEILAPALFYISR